jgi:Dyp-type peroxidase family
VDDIQGNSIAGFMKPVQGVIALSFGPLDGARAWLRDMAPALTTLAGVMPSRLKVRQERLAQGVTAGHTQAAAELDDVWVNLGVSFQGLTKLLGDDPQHAGDLTEFTDEAFTQGLLCRSALLGDPVDPAAEGHPDHWVVGGPDTVPDVLIVVGADRPERMADTLQGLAAAASDLGLAVLYSEQGGKLDAAGSEQFGFRDGVSQPGPRGRLDDGTYLTPRTIDPSVEESVQFGLPGQYLVWPGEFVFGYPAAGADPLVAGPVSSAGPGWSRNGSYLVFRRLRQDVAAFRSFVEDQAAAVAREPGFEHMTPALLEAQIFGRWPSGAPVARTPTADDPALGGDPLANNHFGFAAASQALPLAGGGTTNTYPQAPSDPIGLGCPLAAHIRKVNTRDAGSDQGGKRASYDRRLLRRGLPFGPVLPPDGPDPVDGDRGLLFLSYQTSIRDQFEFLNTSWMGDPTNPRAPSGHDLPIGQNAQPGEDRVRTATLLSPTATSCTVTATAQFVIPTGGGYFFSPSISAITQVLAAG